MKVTENVTVYQCEHCGKKLFRKHAMIKHEELCNNNHKNYKACMAGCAFLEKTQIDAHWIVDNPSRGDNVKQVDTFKCTKLDKLMFPFSIEKRKLHERYDTYSDQEPMPNTCDEFENIEGLEIFSNPIF